MNIRQLRYISAVAKNGLNVSATAERLYTSQPGVSKQIRLLEDELGIQIFERSGRQLTRITPEGEALIQLADRALVEIDALKRSAREMSAPDQGHLSIAASHTQAKFALAPVLESFHARYPKVTLSLREGTPEQIARLLTDGEVDFALATEALEHFEDVLLLPCYRWQRAAVVPAQHPLAQAANEGVALTLEALAEHPLLTYEFGFRDGSVLRRAFDGAELKPRVALTATDADVIIRYVRAGFGVGLIARMAFEADAEARRLHDRLVSLDVEHLFEPSTVKLGLNRGTYLRRYMYDFMELFAPRLTRERVDSALGLGTPRAVEALFLDEEMELL